MSGDNTNKPEEVFEVAPEYDFSGGQRGRFYIPKKITTTIRLDDDIIVYFKKKSGRGKDRLSNPHQHDPPQIHPRVKLRGPVYIHHIVVDQ